jgi:putative ABC transport system ATP-binding protein
MTAIEARDLHRTYEQGDSPVHALRGVDLAVQPGEFVAVMGPSGSGKSTLLHLLGGLDRPDSGSVEVDGQDLATLGEPELALVRRRRIGFVLQFANLLPTLTAAENVGFPLMLDGRKDAAVLSAAALERVGLGGRGSHRPGQLSGGEQQRVAIARAVATKPAVVLADEPTGSLDTLLGEDILRLLRSVADDGQAVVMITHEPRAAAYANRVLRLRDGAMVNGTDESTRALTP